MFGKSSEPFIPLLYTLKKTHSVSIMESLTARTLLLFCCILCTDAVKVKVSGYDPMANLINITCNLNGNVYSDSKEIQWTTDGKYLTGCNPGSCMDQGEKRYKFTTMTDSVTITIEPINFDKDDMKWTCTLDGVSDNVNLQFFPVPYNAASTQKHTNGSGPMGVGMPVLNIVNIALAVITLILVIVIIIVLVQRRKDSSDDPENRESSVPKNRGNGKGIDMKPLLAPKDKDKERDDAAARADATLIENSVRDHRDKIKGISEEMKKTEKVVSDAFETAKEVEGLAKILLKLSKGEPVKNDDKGYERVVDPKEALREELHGEIQKRGDRLKIIGAEYENEPQEVTLANKNGNFTETQTLINAAKKHMCTTKQVEGDLRDFSKGTKKVLDTVKETMNEIRPNLQKK